MNQFCIIKVNHDEKYVAVISGGSRAECEAKLAYINGLDDGLKYSYLFSSERLPNIEFKIIPQTDYDKMHETEAVKGVDIYEQMYA